MVSAVASGPETFELYPKKTDGMETLKMCPYINETILSIDPDFYKNQTFIKFKKD